MHEIKMVFYVYLQLCLHLLYYCTIQVLNNYVLFYKEW